MSASNSTPISFRLTTRTSFISRLRDREDRLVWDRFYKDYKTFLRRIAEASGLRRRDAEEVTQDVISNLPKAIDEFERQRGPRTFRTWLGRLAQWRVMDHWRRLAGHKAKLDHLHASTDPSETVAHGPDLTVDQKLEAEFRKRVMDLALQRLNRRFAPLTLQIFGWYVVDGVPATEVAKFFKIPKRNVHVAKFRVMPHFKREVLAALARLEKSGEKPQPRA